MSDVHHHKNHHDDDNLKHAVQHGKYHDSHAPHFITPQPPHPKSNSSSVANTPRKSESHEDASSRRNSLSINNREPHHHVHTQLTLHATDVPPHLKEGGLKDLHHIKPTETEVNDHGHFVTLKTIFPTSKVQPVDSVDVKHQQGTTPHQSPHHAPGDHHENHQHHGRHSIDHDDHSKSHQHHDRHSIDHDDHSKSHQHHGRHSIDHDDHSKSHQHHDRHSIDHNDHVSHPHYPGGHNPSHYIVSTKDTQGSFNNLVKQAAHKAVTDDEDDSADGDFPHFEPGPDPNLERTDYHGHRSPAVIHRIHLARREGYGLLILICIFIMVMLILFAF